MRRSVIHILESAVNEIRRDREERDPELREWCRQEQELRRTFFLQHQDDPELQEQLLKILDTVGMVEGLEREYSFRLGLQMGLELGRLDLFPPE